MHGGLIGMVSGPVYIRSRMIGQSEQPWIEAGYRIFALAGPDAIRIEQLAREVGISKSSFYHHFADVPVFIERLLYWHSLRAQEIARKARVCRTVDPDFLRLLAAHDMDLLFNRQLRIHRNNMAYQLCFQRANSVVEDEIESIWAEALGIPDQPRIARNIFSVVSDLFYQRVTRETLNYAWMVAFLAEVNGFMRDVIRSSGIQLGQAG